MAIDINIIEDSIEIDHDDTLVCAGFLLDADEQAYELRTTFLNEEHQEMLDEETEYYFLMHKENIDMNGRNVRFCDFQCKEAKTGRNYGGAKS